MGGEAKEGIGVRLCWILEGKARIQELILNETASLCRVLSIVLMPAVFTF